MCKILGALGVDMQVANLDGNGPIHIAAEAGHAEAVRVFIDKGISPDTPGAGGQVVSPRGVVEGLGVILLSDVQNLDGAAPLCG